MQTVVFVLFVAVAAVNAGLLPLHETGTLLKGPSARSTIVGADGLGVNTVFEGGVVAPTHDVAVAVPEVVVARAEPIISYAEPIIARAEPIIARAEPLITHVEPIIARHEPLISYAEPLITRAEPVIARQESFIAPVWEHGRSDIIAGPSGTIITNKDYLQPIVPAQREIFVEPAVRTVLPAHGLTYGRSLFEHGLVGQGFGLGRGLYGDLALNRGLFNRFDFL